MALTVAAIIHRVKLIYGLALPMKAYATLIGGIVALAALPTGNVIGNLLRRHGVIGNPKRLCLRLQLHEALVTDVKVPRLAFRYLMIMASPILLHGYFQVRRENLDLIRRRHRTIAA